MKIALTGRGAFASAFTRQFPASIASLREGASYDDADVIIHNAAKINCVDDDDAFQANVVPTEQLLAQAKGKKIIYLSSMTVEDDSIDTPYSRSKEYCEELIAEFAPSATIIRFSSIFYAAKDRDALSFMIHTAKTLNYVSVFGNGNTLRDWLPLTSATQAVAAIAADRSADGATITLASGVATSFFDLARMISGLRPGTAINFLKGEERHVKHIFDRTVHVDLKAEIAARLRQ